MIELSKSKRKSKTIVIIRKNFRRIDAGTKLKNILSGFTEKNGIDIIGCALGKKSDFG